MPDSRAVPREVLLGRDMFHDVYICRVKVAFWAGYPQYCVDNRPKMWIKCGKYCTLWIFHVDNRFGIVDKPEGLCGIVVVL